MSLFEWMDNMIESALRKRNAMLEEEAASLVRCGFRPEELTVCVSEDNPLDAWIAVRATGEQVMP